MTLILKSNFKYREFGLPWLGFIPMHREVRPHVPDGWVDESKTKIGYEINFSRFFYKYTPPRPLEEIEAELKGFEEEIADMLAGVTE